MGNDPHDGSGGGRSRRCCQQPEVIGVGEVLKGTGDKAAGRKMSDGVSSGR